MDLGTRKCEDCQQKVATFGEPHESKRRWCGGCAKLGHPVAVNKTQVRMCKECKQVKPATSFPKGGSRRRCCSDCAPSSGTAEAEAEEAQVGPCRSEQSSAPNSHLPG